MQSRETVLIRVLLASSIALY